jgi:hypothetical protein
MNSDEALAAIVAFQSQQAPTVTTTAASPAAAVAVVAAPAPAPAPALLSAGAAYTPAAMVKLMVTQPDYSHAQLCAHFGRPRSWLSTVLASEAFQEALQPHKSQIQDPLLTATLQERFQALAIRTSNVMLEKLEDPEKANDFLVVKSAEVAIKALGMDRKPTAAEVQAAQLREEAAKATPTDSLAERIMKMMDARETGRTVDVEAVDVAASGDV